MGICIQFGAVSGDWGYGKRIRERERLCVFVAVWRRAGRRKESCNVGVPTYVCVYVCVYTYVCIHMYVYMCMYVYIYIYIYIYIYVCVCVCVCAYCLLTLTGSRCKM